MCHDCSTIECIHPSAQDKIESSHYVTAAERVADVESVDFTGRENDTDINELLAKLISDKGVSEGVLGAQEMDIDMEEESPENELFSEPQLTWCGCLDVDSQMEGGLVQRIRDVEALFQNTNSNGTDHNRAGESSYLLSGSRSREPFIISRRGCEFDDSNDIDFFPKAFPKLFPFGVGGPRTANSEGSWGLLPWARLCLQRHGKNAVFIP
jgi:hypothetical protein